MEAALYDKKGNYYRIKDKHKDVSAMYTSLKYSDSLETTFFIKKKKIMFILTGDFLCELVLNLKIFSLYTAPHINTYIEVLSYWK